jgi:hypothetical protein
MHDRDEGFMPHRNMPVAALLIALAPPGIAVEPAPTAKEIRAVIVKALPLIQFFEFFEMGE